MSDGVNKGRDASQVVVDETAVSDALNRITLSWLPVAATWTIIGSLAVPLIIWSSGHDVELVIWTVVVTALVGLGLWIVRNAKGQSPGHIRRALESIFLLDVAVSICWILILLLPDYDQYEQPFVIGIVSVLLVSGAVTVHAAAPRYYFVFAVPVVAVSSMRLFLSDLQSSNVVAVFMLIFLVGTSRVLLANFSATRRQVTARLRSNNLLDELGALNREHERELGVRRRTQRQLMARDEVLHEMYRVVSDHEVSYQQRLESLLALGCRHLDMCCGVILRQSGEAVVVEASQCNSPELGLEPSMVTPLYQLAADKGAPLFVADLSREPVMAARVDKSLHAIAASPISGTDRAVLCLVDTKVHCHVTKFDQDLQQILANWIALEMGRESVIDDLRFSEQEMRNLADVLPFSVAYLDRDLRFQFVNRSMAMTNRTSAALLVGQSLRQVVGEAMFGKVGDQVTGALLGERQDFEIQLTGDEKTVDYQVTYLPDRRQGEVVGFYQVLLDITESKREQEQLQHRASHDELTGLPNRGEIYYQIERLIDRRGAAGPHALCYVDLDNFKPINDSLGHHAGDAALRWFSEQLRAVTRSSDFVARIGGDEFAILLPGCSGSLARRITDGLHSLLASTPFEFEGSVFSLQTSMGVIEFRGGQSDPEALIAKADAVCYRAKQAGGGRTA